MNSNRFSILSKNPRTAIAATCGETLNPKGIPQQSPGLRGTSYPGKMPTRNFNPEGVAARTGRERNPHNNQGNPSEPRHLLPLGGPRSGGTIQPQNSRVYSIAPALNWRPPIFVLPVLFALSLITAQTCAHDWTCDLCYSGAVFFDQA